MPSASTRLSRVVAHLVLGMVASFWLVMGYAFVRPEPALEFDSGSWIQRPWLREFMLEAAADRAGDWTKRDARKLLGMPTVARASGQDADSLGDDVVPAAGAASDLWILSYGRGPLLESTCFLRLDYEGTSDNAEVIQVNAARGTQDGPFLLPSMLVSLALGLMSLVAVRRNPRDEGRREPA